MGSQQFCYQIFKEHNQVGEDPWNAPLPMYMSYIYGVWTVQPVI